MTRAIDWRSERRKFPIFETRNYCAAQCLGPCLEETYADLAAYVRSIGLRSRALPEWADRWRELHALTEDVLDAPRGTVFLADSATAAHAAFAAALQPEGKRSRIVISNSDFHSTRYLWTAQAKRGFDVVEVASKGVAHGDAATYLDAIDERTRVVALSLVSPRSGALLDAMAIVARAREVGALTILDAYQGMGIVPVAVREIGADAIVGGYHKWLSGAGMGLAFAYVSPDLTERLVPVYPGWLGSRDFLGFSEVYEPSPTATRFSQGTPAMEPVYSARAGLRWVLDVGIENLRARSLELTERVVRGAKAAGLALNTPSEPERRGGMVCLDIADATGIAAKLAEHAIDVDARPGAGLRIGPHPCAREEEIDRVIAVIAEASRR